MLSKTKYLMAALIMSVSIFLPSFVEASTESKNSVYRHSNYDDIYAEFTTQQKLVAYSRDVEIKVKNAKIYCEKRDFYRVIYLLEGVRERGVTDDKEVNQLLSKACINYSYVDFKNNRIRIDKYIELNLKAFSLDPLRPEASYKIATAYGEKKEAAEGIKWLEKAYPIITRFDNDQLLQVILNDPELNNLRSYLGFNDKFPNLALKINVEGNAQISKNDASIGKRLEKTEEKQNPQLSTQTAQVNPTGNLGKIREIDKTYALYKIKEDTKYGVSFSIFNQLTLGLRQVRLDLEEVCNCKHGYRGGSVTVIGEYFKNVDQTDENLIKELILRAANFAFEACPDLKKYGKDINFYFYDDKLNPGKQYNSPISSYINHENYEKIQWIKNVYYEKLRAKKLEQERIKNQEEKNKMILEEQNAFKKFSEKNDIVAWPDNESIDANPFVYEGKNIGLRLYFEEMSTATQGIFSDKKSATFVISDIPKGLYTKGSSRTVVAVKVIGKTQTNIPIVGNRSVPLVKFVDIYCKDPECNQIESLKRK
jgi:hypothetical protein